MKISIIATNGKSLLNFRGNLIKDWIAQHNMVDCVSIESKSQMSDLIKELGATYTQICGNRNQVNIFTDIKMFVAYIRYFKTTNPDVCFLYMSKPVAYGGIAARICRVLNVNIMISGLEIAFYKGHMKNKIIRIFLVFLYSIACKKAKNVFFQNPDDKAIFLKYGIVKAKQCTLVGGSGVDMDFFTQYDIQRENDVVLMVGRLVRYKGIYDYVKAAQILKRKYPNVTFQVLGGFDNNSDAMTREEMNQIVESGVIEYLGYLEDVRPVIRNCSIFVLPSQFEGTPRSTLEAMAIGRPVITANTPGCKETVKQGYNGYLIEYGNYKSLADKIEVLINDHVLRNKMGAASYEYCKEKFDVKKVNRIIINKMFI